jgi:UDP-N-acetylglucosamine 2-epimerase (non-hydrolysing)
MGSPVGSSRGAINLIKIVSIVGTRPEVIKMAPVIRALDARPEIEQIVVATAQHREMLDQILDVFEFEPDYDLDVMSHAANPSEVAGRVLISVSKLFEELEPDVVLVQGDTTSVLAVSLCCFYSGIAVGHVEAGLRSHDLQSPYPEELNRRVAALATRMHFAPTPRARENLLEERVPDEQIHLVGNTIVDALAMLDITADLQHPQLRQVDFGTSRVLVVTAHRRESHGAPLHAICAALAALTRKFPDVEIVFPVHLNPRVRKTVRAALGETSRIHLVDPLPYDEMLRVMARSFLLLTDSGGIQEEAPTLSKPVLVLRDVTERPEVVDAGVGVLVGTSTDTIVAEASRLLEDDEAYARMTSIPNPFGDGLAAERIARIVGAVEAPVPSPAVATGL